MSHKIMLRSGVSAAPSGYEKLKWYGPGLLWMLSAVGTGSILFTPRVASQYEYQLLWLLLLVVFFMWVMIREMARYSIATGNTMLEGMYRLEGPKGWAVWIIFVPQLMAAAVGIAGLAAVVGSALASFLPGTGTLYAISMVLGSTLFTVTGNYMRIERYSRYMAMLLLAIVVASALAVFPDAGTVASGLPVQWPDEADLYIIMPWVGTILAGSMGIVWFGYWTIHRGFGGGLESEEAAERRDAELSSEQKAKLRRDKATAPATKVKRIKDWLGIMNGAATLGVVGGLLVIFAFMVLGSELLAPEALLPEGSDVAVDLARLFSGIWGEPGKYLMLAAVAIALGGSILANQDGWGRSFADMTLILTREHRQDNNTASAILARLNRIAPWPLFRRVALKRFYIGLVTGLVPVLILLAFKDPVRIMSASGIIAAAHTPFIVLTALIVNRTQLPVSVRPSLLGTGFMAAAGLFYLGFAGIYIFQLLNDN